jgi:hypothetical protein
MRDAHHMQRHMHDPEELERGAPRGPSDSEHAQRKEQIESQRRQHDVIAGRRAAAKFVGRVAQLDHDAVREVVATWRQSMRAAYDSWFAAEDAVAQAIASSGRHVEQRPLLMHVADAFSQRVWPGGGDERSGAAERHVHATEASGQYLATLAMLAVLVRDHLDAATFDQVYEPFGRLVPISELAPE